eukprot:TRINITY_DN33830_c0_g1_i2.p1 TRINITY_DN33830_c0_g1~~TRINITY_DN33830_c0_g1_i2.p1  ORF type:complete len:630 (+),score=146.76 TRINITY_DN33830_c0_g1_i2:72-1961(+)
METQSALVSIRQETKIIQEKIADLANLWQYHTDHQEAPEDLLAKTVPSFPVTKARIPATIKTEDNLTGLDTLIGDHEETEGSHAWIEHTWAQSIVGFVILLNAVLIGLETDIESPYWLPVEHMFLAFFTVEFLVKLARYRLGFFSSFGNTFDAFVLFSGAADLWVTPVYSWLLHRKQGQSASLKIMQLLRLLRIVRLIRLVRIIKPLYSLALGIAQACQGMFWVLLFLFMMLYAVSILATRLLGLKDESEYPEEEGESAAYQVRAMFDSVLSSMFVLFESITCWSLMDFVPLFRVVEGSRLVAVTFYMFANWALLAVMTGVVSEKMMAVKERMSTETDDGDKKEKEYGLAEQDLLELFHRADIDDSGEISHDEFNNMLLCTDVMKPLMLNSALDAQDLHDLFIWLDVNKDNKVSATEFTQGFKWLIANIDPKGLLRLEEELGHEIYQLKKLLLAHVDKVFDHFLAEVSIPIRKIMAVTEQIQRLDRVLDHLRESSSEGKDKILCRTLDETERRISQRLDMLADAVAKLDKLQKAGAVKLRPECIDDDHDHDEAVAAMLQLGVLKKKKKKKAPTEEEEETKQDEEQEEDEEELIFFEPQWDIGSEDEDLPPGIGKSTRIHMTHSSSDFAI